MAESLVLALDGGLVFLSFLRARENTGHDIEDWKVAQEGFIYSKDLPGGSLFSFFLPGRARRKEDRRDEDLPTVKENSAISCNIRVLLSTVELSLHPLSSHEVESVRKEKERLTAASAALSFPFTLNINVELESSLFSISSGWLFLYYCRPC